jgi:hypothetical protein
MPLTNFICPDNQQIPVTECWKQCRLGHRCLTLPTLKLVGAERQWAGVASTTQLLNGTQYQFLVLTKPFAVKPNSRLFSLLGTTVHRNLDEQAKELGLPSEVALSGDRDIFDLLEPIDRENKLYDMTDYKTWGSFKVAKALGIVQVGKKPDPSGEVYKSSGKWGQAGSPKMIPAFGKDDSKADNMEATLQLNRYRIKLMEQYEVRLASMQLQVIVRDGGTYIAEGRGVMELGYLIPVSVLPDELVSGYFKMKDDNLHKALEQGSWSEPCNPSENWDNIRCKEYCEVWEYCGYGQAIHSLKG